MKYFFKRFLLFLIPLIIGLLGIIHLDVYKVFYSYDDYYKNKITYFSREMVTTNTYIKYKDQLQFDSFIFGSSRSMVYQTNEWKKYLDKGAVPFHFDANAESVYGVCNKIKFIDKKGGKINNALIIIDREFLSKTINSSDEFISPVCLTNESYLKYYWIFIQPCFDLKFLFAYLDYLNFKTYRKYMIPYFADPKGGTGIDSDPITCDAWFRVEGKIASDSLAYYKEQIIFNEFVRSLRKAKECKVTLAEIDQLKIIKAVFDRHHTRYKIVISPIYDQIPLEKEQLRLLNSILGKEHIYNFSGVNKFTKSIGNYYEHSHYRPFVANEILKEIYSIKD